MGYVSALRDIILTKQYAQHAVHFAKYAQHPLHALLAMTLLTPPRSVGNAHAYKGTSNLQARPVKPVALFAKYVLQPLNALLAMINPILP